ncbi:MAG TPA: glycosyltransferase [Acidimicrobiales bacterium]|nr:glycosyltransferase [Acidimicrobiales bacterium]
MSARIPILVLTAGMGAGHDQVAHELSDRLERRGFRAELVDLWDLMPLGLGRLMTGFYRLMIRRAPWLYSIIYRIWFRPSDRHRASVSPVTRLAQRRLAQRVAELHPAAVLSTFHVCSQLLGELRRRGRTPAPVASIVVDFAAHGLWVHPDVDAHLCLHPRQADRIKAQGGKGVAAPGPVVRVRFTRPTWTRADARSTLGVSAEERMVLVVAGSWGAGDVAGTVGVLADAGEFRMFVLTGDNEELRRRLVAKGGATVFGWVDDMDRFMAAADAVVENAGGLTAMEAMASGVPVISYAPIPGHGRQNVERMAEVGISLYARDRSQLVEYLHLVTTDGPTRRRLLATAADISGPTPPSWWKSWHSKDPAARPGARPADDRPASPRRSGTNDPWPAAPTAEVKRPTGRERCRGGWPPPPPAAPPSWWRRPSVWPTTRRRTHRSWRPPGPPRR